MKVLAIETSCDETAISVLEAKGNFRNPSFKLRSAVVHSQASLHAEWFGVVPSLAKREHDKNLLPILLQALRDARMYKEIKNQPKAGQPRADKIEKIFTREPELLENFWKTVTTIEPPEIDLIAVTYGPGLEPALWTGINFAKALSLIWKKPIVPINHMEGHILSVLLPEDKNATSPKITLPALTLLISGGHTELVKIRDWLKYKVIGHTRDDAVGEAFDKVARMLGLPYPGGPEISRLAAEYEKVINAKTERKIKLPRPMISSGDYDFSFSGLKTAVLYTIKKLPVLSEELKKEIAYEFEQSVIDILASKTRAAMKEFKPKTLIIGGGVIANKKIRESFLEIVKDFPKTKLLIPHLKYSTDNASMIAIAAYFRWLDNKNNKRASKKNFEARGNLVLK